MNLTYDEWCAAVKRDADMRLKRILNVGSRKRARRARMTYAERVAELEAEGLTTSDAQGVADCEAEQGRAFRFNPAAPLDPHGEAD